MVAAYVLATRSPVLTWRIMLSAYALAVQSPVLNGAVIPQFKPPPPTFALISTRRRGFRMGNFGTDAQRGDVGAFRRERVTERSTRRGT
eukprot:662502-Rhodomonas_salina.1